MMFSSATDWVRFQDDRSRQSRGQDWGEACYEHHQLLLCRKMSGTQDSWQQSSKWDGDSQDIVNVCFRLGVTCAPDFVTFITDSQDNRGGGRGQVTDECFVSQDFNS